MTTNINADLFADIGLIVIVFLIVWISWLFKK